MNNQTYYQLNRDSRLAYGKRYYIKNREKIRVYQNNYLKGYYYRKKMNIYLKKGGEQNHEWYLQFQANKKKKRKERKKERKRIKLIRKYWDIWHQQVFGERDRIRELLTVRFD